jgi:hypothetical protein
MLSEGALILQGFPANLTSGGMVIPTTVPHSGLERLRDELLNGEMFATRRRQATPVARPPTTRILPPACGLPYAFAPSAHGLAKVAEQDHPGTA